MNTPTKIGRYEILAELGRGAMGIVYRAKDPAVDRVVALKTIISVALASPQGSEFRDRFYREARTAGALTHPGIVAVFDVGEHEGMPFLVMEFVDGRTLADSIKAGECMNVDRICEFGGQIADALAHAHQRGVVHRDIKPANILLTSIESSGVERPKITDFGVAKLAEGQATITGQMLGTPAFMPPEQFTGAPIDGRSDIFSLGVVLYWMATGERPFPGESITAVSYKVVHTDPIPPRKLNPSLPTRLESIILRCLAKNPAERFQTGSELARELTELKSGDKTTVHQTTMHRPIVADPDATRADSIPLEPVGTVNAALGSSQTTTAEPKRGRSMVMVALVALLLVAGVGYALRSRQTPVVESVPPPVETVSAEPVSAPVETPVPTEIAKPAPVIPKATTAATAPAATPPPSLPVMANVLEPNATTSGISSAPVETAPEPAPLDFDPKTLDRKQNARLEIDASRMPPDLDFIVEMNGKVYVRKTGLGIYKENDDLFVPPGVHEFRVMAQSGEVEKVSNTVSTDFRPNKRNTMRIELRLEGKSANAGMPRGLYPTSQIVVTLK
jgi:eukaryotic-like serine/threonine-protein kinase